MKLSIKRDGKYSIETENAVLHARVDFPRIAGEEEIYSYQFSDLQKEEFQIGKLKGCKSTDQSVQNGILVTREFFVSDNGSHIGVRLKIKNQRETSFNLDLLSPLVTVGEDGLLIGNQGLADWRFVRNSRNKNDVPGGFDLSIKDENLEDAALETSTMRAGGGVAGEQGDFLSYEDILAEPFFYVMNKRKAQPGLFFGILGQNEHLTTFRIKSSEDRTRLERIVCQCEFDKILVDPGEERVTHWLLLFPVVDETSVKEDFTQIFMDEFKIARTKKDLSIFCTWQFYGYDFYPEDLDETLVELKRRGIPVDVVQLDNGWIDHLGDWDANHLFPNGMKEVADKIKAEGYIPGIWTAPFIVERDSTLFHEHPEMAAKLSTGEYAPYTFGFGDVYTLDVTAPYCEEYFKKAYGKLKEWGFTYHKLDFMRAVTIHPNIVFHDKKCTRAQAYRRGNELLRKALGDDCYIASCGGVNDGANAGIADSVRTGQDVYSFWVPPDKARWKGTLIKIKQNIFRNYTNLLWAADPDAAPIRRRGDPFRPDVRSADLSLGLFTDEEAFSISLVQYLTGGNVCISERLAEIDDDRAAMFRHYIPTLSTYSKILDYSLPICPNYYLTEITPRTSGMKPWQTLAVGNWKDEEDVCEIDLGKTQTGGDVKELAVFEFHDQKFYGVKKANGKFTVSIPPHGMRLFRLAEWDGVNPVIIGTDLHFSGGAAELTDVVVLPNEIRGVVDTKWRYPVKVSAAFPQEDGKVVLGETTVKAGDREFSIVPRQPLIL